MKILAIETSCDETGMVLIESDAQGKITVLVNLVSSQIETHRPFGGVVPNLAKREHQKNLPLLLDQLTVKIRSLSHRIKLKDIDLIAVTNGPGLAPCLWAGVNFAQELAQKLNKPLVGINHLKGHIYINTLEYTLAYPVLSLIVSGGHTQLVFSKKLGHYQIIGETQDDAAGEAFDKVAKLLGLKYPGGPEISKLAKSGDPQRFNLPRPMINSKNFDFSFSGLKTSVLYLVNGIPKKGGPFEKDRPLGLRLTSKNKADLAASFEQAVVDVLVSKTLLAAKTLNPNTLILGGGVAANNRLRETLKKELGHSMSKLVLPEIKLTTDNALMIALAALAEYKLIKPEKDPLDLKADPNLRLDS